MLLAVALYTPLRKNVLCALCYEKKEYIKKIRRYYRLYIGQKFM